MGVILGVIGVVAAVALIGKIIEIIGVLLSSPIFWIALAVAVVLIVIVLVKIWKDIKIEEEEKARQEEEQRRRDELRRAFEETRRKERERNTLRFKCPHCGKEYAEYPASSLDVLRVCEGRCHRHFYPTEDQTPRTPNHAAQLAGEERDAERVRSMEFHELHNAVERMTQFPSSCGWSVEFDALQAEMYNGSGIVYMEYPSRLETTAGQYMLAISCGRMFPSVLYHVSVEKSNRPRYVKLFWCRKED